MGLPFTVQNTLRSRHSGFVFKRSYIFIFKIAQLSGISAKILFLGREFFLDTLRYLHTHFIDSLI